MPFDKWAFNFSLKPSRMIKNSSVDERRKVLLSLAVRDYGLHVGLNPGLDPTPNSFVFMYEASQSSPKYTLKKLCVVLEILVCILRWLVASSVQPHRAVFRCES